MTARVRYSGSGCLCAAQGFAREESTVTHGVGTPVLWIGFTLLVLVLLTLDLTVFHRHDRDMGQREALLWTGFWIALAVGFNVWMFLTLGKQHGLEFLTGYVIEYSLSIDNLFVF